jgi:hypothetical protein
MRKPLFAMILGLAAWHMGCAAPPRIDTSSEEATSVSLSEVRESLPERVRPAFDDAVKTVVLSGYAEEAERETAAGVESFGARALAPLNGMTAEEVLTEAQRIEAEAEETRGRSRREPGRSP